jgi:hypothetical protein
VRGLSAVRELTIRSDHKRHPLPAAGQVALDLVALQGLRGDAAVTAQVSGCLPRSR